MKQLMIISILTFFSCFELIAQNSVALGLKDDRVSRKLKTVSSKVVYDYSCLADPLSIFVDIKGQTLNALVEDVPDEEENKFGDRYHKEIKESGEWTLITNGAKLQALKKIMNDLLQCRREPLGLKYTMHLINSEVINAFTCGGHIYVTTGIIDYLETTSELAAIIAHEIGHNEMGHIKLMLKELALAQNVAGEFGQIFIAVERFAAPAFNQRNEIEADQYGASLAIAAGYQPCRSVKIWERMAEDEGEYNMLMNFLRSHPYSSVRRQCLIEHIRSNYQVECN